MATSQVPAFIKKDLAIPQGAQSGLGNDNVTMEDISLPRIKIMQALSPELDEDSDSYIDGAKQGNFINSVTGAIYESFYAVNLYYERFYALFRKRQAGGGLVGRFDTQADARAMMDNEGLNPEEHDIVETARHYLAILDDKGEIVDQVLYDMSSTALSVSSGWNTKIQTTKADRFASVWKVDTRKRKNAKGSWSVPNVEFAGFVSDDLYTRTKALYMSLSGHSEQ